MAASLDTYTSAGSGDRFRILLDQQRADCVHQREEALVECAQSVPDPVAQRRSADLLVTIGEIDAALARLDAGTYGRCTGCQAEIPEERLELRPFAGTCVACTRAH
jgi:RNA polymerase-binding transcription factor DksA